MQSQRKTVRRRQAAFAAAVVVNALLCACLLAPPAGAAFGFDEPELTILAEDGLPATQAGSHPLSVTATFHLNTRDDPDLGLVPDGSPRDMVIDLPAGLVIDPQAAPRCSSADFRPVGSTGETSCPDATAVGVFGLLQPGQTTSSEITPVYNLVPPPGGASLLGFRLNGVSVTIEGALRGDGERNLFSSISGISQAETIFGGTLTMWGNPASSVHDTERGHCIRNGGSCPVDPPERPFVTLPRSCTGPLSTLFSADSWEFPGAWVGAEALTPGMQGCQSLGLSPTIGFRPTANAAGSASSLDFSLDLDDPGLTDSVGVAQSDLRSARLVLPAEMTANPAFAEGLGACSGAEYERETLSSDPGSGCPDSSKIGTALLDSPLLEQPVEGPLFVARPDSGRATPHDSLDLSLYMVLREPAHGILLKQRIAIEPDPENGRLTATAADLPQIPLSHLELHFRQGTPSPLVIPPACGSHAVRFELEPWAGGAPVVGDAGFGVEGRCGAPGFQPRLQAGVTHPRAGAVSTFVATVTHSDGEQVPAAISLELPPGLSADFGAVPLCPELGVAAGDCPFASRLGYARIAAGVGTSPLWIPQPGNPPSAVYLAGAYREAPFSLAVVVPAVAGPFDLGTVVLRAPIFIDPHTAQASLRFDRLPQLLEGIPIDYRAIRIVLDRPGFVRNPTSCELNSVQGTATSSIGTRAALADNFQVGDCGALRFRPKLSAQLLGPTHRSAHPGLRAVVQARPGDANIGRVTATLPGSELLNSRGIHSVCTVERFDASSCPPSSVRGRAKVWTPLLDRPLAGPVYLRSGSSRLPDLAAALDGPLRLDLAAGVDATRGRLRVSFRGLPDVPLSKVVLTLQGGEQGLLVNSGGVCRGPRRLTAILGAQSGRALTLRPRLRAGCPDRTRK
ncbi:MAG: hypothetical protein ACJ75T_07365 [Solirubrobacterales bacterium]